MVPVLNWKELAALVSAYRARTSNLGLYVERVFVPDRPRFPGGFVRSEWGVRLSGRKKELTFVFSVRPRSPYLMMAEERGPRPAKTASHSPFDLAVSKHLKGAKFLEIVVFERERSVVLWFEGHGRIGLVLALIPALPEALLISADHRMLARSRNLELGTFVAPDGLKAPSDLGLRAELVESPEAYRAAVEAELDREAFDLRLHAAERAIRDSLKLARDRIRQNRTSVDEALAEPDWKRYGELLKATLPAAPEIGADGTRALPDYETGLTVQVPGDPKLSPKSQVEKYFSLARRKEQRREQAKARLEGFAETLARLERALASRPDAGDWRGLESFERVATGGLQPAAREERKKRGHGWMGKSFVSRDGLPIWVGRSRDENLELTFKNARGNDVWMHVRGRPGAHVLVPVPSGKSVPLETLLDAAVLCIYYSGGESWGKTEVDYTFKKYVKRIKDSTEASYTHNKTLIVEPEQARLKRLLSTD